MAKKNTSMRLPEDLRDRLSVAADAQGSSVSALIERYAREGLAMERHPGIVFRPGPGGRRAGLSGGPDVWEVVSALRDLKGTESERVHTLADQMGLHPRQIAIALSYAAEQADEINDRIAANDKAISAAEQAHGARLRMLDSA
ncbi:MAG: CopG family transcriptional regulator [Euzebya sp.]